MDNPQKAIGVILTVALLLAAAGAIVFMRACLKPSPVSHPSPITKTIPAPTPRACCDSLGLPYTQTPSPTPSHEPAIVPRAKLSKVSTVERKVSDVATPQLFYFAGEVVNGVTIPDGMRGNVVQDAQLPTCDLSKDLLKGWPCKIHLAPTSPRVDVVIVACLKPMTLNGYVVKTYDSTCEWQKAQPVANQ